ncbi:MAG: HAMP domain-containing protein [Myxococcales bacterium]|nr:HAMP domain-containing protein [Myxococcales bacterium]
MRDPRPVGDAPPRAIARQLALGFGMVSVVAVAMCAVLLAIIHDVSQLVSGMRHDEHAIRQGLELATAVREQSTLMAAALVDPDPDHVRAYEARRADVRARIQQLSADVPEPERWRVAVLGEKTQGMHDHFSAAALPAARQGDLQTVRAVHGALEGLEREAAEQADALARAMEGKMAHAHVLATDSTRLGMLAGGLCVLGVLGLSVGFTVRLRAAVLRPLVALTEAARRFGRGDFSARVGAVGSGELGALAQAFDRMTEELAAREARLVESERLASIGQLAAGVAHEVGNPLTGILMVASNLRRERLDADVSERLGMLIDQANRIQDIVRNLVDFSRADGGAAETGREARDAVTVREVVNEAVALLELGRRTREVRCDVEIDAAICVRGDRQRLIQVFLNLLANACDASRAGQAVEVRASEGALGWVRVDVIDHGVGVTEAQRARLFDPFFTTKPVGEGTGLGLAVVFSIVRSHGGRVEVDDTPGGGCTMQVFLLAQPEDAS